MRVDACQCVSMRVNACRCVYLIAFPLASFASAMKSLSPTLILLCLTIGINCFTVQMSESSKTVLVGSDSDEDMRLHERTGSCVFLSICCYCYWCCLLSFSLSLDMSSTTTSSSRRRSFGFKTNARASKRKLVESSSEDDLFG